MRNFRQSCSFVLVFQILLTSCGHGDRSEEFSSTKQNIPNPGQTDLLIGSGYDSLTGESKDRCIEDGELTRAGGSDSQSQSVTFRLKRIESYHELQQDLNMSASGTYRSGIFKHSARAEYLRSLRYNSFSSFMLVSVRVVHGTETLGAFKLKKAAQSLIQSSPEAFYRTCGDRFVSGRTSGGELLAVVEFYSKSRVEKERVDARIRSGGGIFNAAGDFHKALSEMSRLATVNITTIRNGGVGRLPAVKDLAEAARSFPEELRDASKPWIYSFQTHDYQLLSASSGNPVAHERQKIYLNASLQSRTRALAQRNDIEYVLSHPQEFEKVSSVQIKKLQMAKNSFEEMIESYDARALLCFADPSKIENCTFPKVEWKHVSLPRRIKNVIQTYGDEEICKAERKFLLSVDMIDSSEFAVYQKFNMAPQYHEAFRRSSGINEWASCEEVVDELRKLHEIEGRAR